MNRSTGLLLAATLLLPATLAGQTRPDEEILWPLPPDAPRIRYEGHLQSARDVGKKSSFFRRMRNGILGEKDWMESIARPWDTFVDDHGVVFISNGSAQGLYVMDPNRKEARWVKGAGRAAVAKAMGIDGDSEGNLYVADPGNRRVVVIDGDGEYVEAYGGPSEMLNPVDVALSPDESVVYVADSYLHQVLVYDRSGELLGRIGKDEGDLSTKEARKIEDLTHTLSAEPTDPHDETSTEPSDMYENRGAGPGEFRYPSFIETAPDGTIYVADAMNLRVQAFGPDGAFSHEFGGLGDGAGRFARVKGIGVDSYGHVYAADAAFSNIQIFDEEGRLLMAFSEMGTGPGQLWMPTGVTVDAQDRILVSDRYNNRVQVFQYIHVDESVVAQTRTDAGPGSH